MLDAGYSILVEYRVSSIEVLDMITMDSLKEVSVVTSPGAREAGWAVLVKSHVSLNVYNVCAVQIGEPGSLPIEIGQQMQAVNLAESFLADGTLPAGTYAVILRAGDKNVFYVKP